MWLAIQWPSACARSVSRRSSGRASRSPSTQNSAGISRAARTSRTFGVVEGSGPLWNERAMSCTEGQARGSPGSDRRPDDRRPAWRSGGSCSAQTSCARGHRVRNRQPLGGSTGEGGSPLIVGVRRRLRRRAGPGSGSSPAARPCTGGSGARYSASAGPTSTSLPRYMTATRSETCLTSGRSCAMNRYASPSSARRRSKRFSTWAWISTSSDDTASSQMISAGSSASARAIATRWACPPDSWRGRRRAVRRRGPGRRGRAASRTRSAALVAATPMPNATSGSSTSSATRHVGSSDPNGSWNTICMSPARLEQLACASARRARLPRNITDPSFGGGACSTERAQRRLARPGLADDPQRLAVAGPRTTRPDTACTTPPFDAAARRAT